MTPPTVTNLPELPVISTASSASMAPVASVPVACALLMLTLYALSAPAAPVTLVITILPADWMASVAPAPSVVPVSVMSPMEAKMLPLNVPLSSVTDAAETAPSNVVSVDFSSPSTPTLPVTFA